MAKHPQNGPVRAGLWCISLAGYVPGALVVYAIWQDLHEDVLVNAPTWMVPFVVIMIASGAILIGVGIAITRRESLQALQSGTTPSHRRAGGAVSGQNEPLVW